MNKYAKHSKAHLTRRLRDNMRDVDDTFDEQHKVELEARDKRATKAFSVSRKMFEILCESELDAEGRMAALQFLSVLQNRFGDR